MEQRSHITQQFYFSVQNVPLLQRFCNKCIFGIKKAIWKRWNTGTAFHGPASLWEARSPCERPCLTVRGPASLWEVRPPCERPTLLVRGPASLSEARPLCKRPCLPDRDPDYLGNTWPPSVRSPCKSQPSMQATWPSCERPSLPVRGEDSL